MQTPQAQEIIYGAINQPVLSQVPITAKRVLDIGCGTGALGRQIKHNNACEVVGVTYSEAESAMAARWLDRVLLCDLNSFSLGEVGKFDCIICSHVLEHLYQPQNLLNLLRKHLTPEGLLLVALPNVLYWKQRLEFLKGKFKYTDGGLMDRTHFRFFDWETAHELLASAGYRIIRSEADGGFPLLYVRKFLPGVATSFVDSTAVKYYPGFFGFQFIFSCRLDRAEN